MRILLYLSAMLILISCNQAEKREIKKYTIEQFYKNLTISGGVFSADESRSLVTSNETGIFNLFEIDLADGSRRQITNSAVESFFAIDYVPGTKQLLYAADKGGNEIDHIYLLNEDGSSLDLTPDSAEVANFFKWSKDKKFMYYRSNKRDQKYFDVYKSAIGTWKAELVYRNDDGLNLSDISDDEQYFSLQRSITKSENRLYLFDRSANKMIEISDSLNPGIYNSSGFSNDGKKFYYTTDSGSEFSYLVEYDIASAARNTLYKTTWDVMYSYLSENEKFRVIATNEDGKNTLIVRDNTKGENIDFPEIPDGDVNSVLISKSEKKMRLSVGTSKAPGNMYLYDFETKELKKITETLNHEINPDDLVAGEVVRYKSFDGLEIPAIYYKPLNASENNKVPALVWVHGGPGGQSKTGYFSLLQYLTNHGYAILAVNNRGSSGYGKTFYRMDDLNHGDKDLKDCVWGKKWLQEQNYIDSSKIGIIGGSYGGYMTMAAMTFVPDEFVLGVNIFGVTNWLRTLKSIPAYWESFRKALYTEMGNPYTDDSVRLHRISPLFHAQRVTKPLMVLQGANDPRVLQVESDEIVAAVKKNNVPVEYVVFPDEGHGFVKKENEIRGYGQILTFLDKYLKEGIEDKSKGN